MSNEDPLFQLGFGQRRTPRDPAESTPRYLRHRVADARRIGGYSQDLLDFLDMLADDGRMDVVWPWLATANARMPSLQNSVVFGQLLWEATHMPRKPINMTRIQRRADQLRELLAGTQFDTERISQLEHQNWRKSYRFEHQYQPEQPQYVPDSALTELLGKVIDWTQSDRWDDPSWIPFVQTKRKSARAINFTCRVYELFLRNGVKIPYPILATIANVALGIEADKPLDADTVRMQVRRYLARRDKWKSDRTTTEQTPRKLKRFRSG